MGCNILYRKVRKNYSITGKKNLYSPLGSPIISYGTSGENLFQIERKVSRLSPKKEFTATPLEDKSQGYPCM